MVDRVVGEELSEPMLEARLDVMLEVMLHVSGFPAENTAFCGQEQKKKERKRKEKEHDFSEHPLLCGDGRVTSFINSRRK